MTLDSIFEKFNQQKVLVIGDVMIDAYLWGKVERISPEAPVPVVNVQKREKRLGGAANVALNIKAMGAEPILCAVIGKDDDSRVFYDLLEKEGLSKKGILQSVDRVTTIKHRILAGHQQLLRVDSEMMSPINEKEENFLIRNIKKLAEDCHLIIFEDYDKGVITEKVIEDVISFANEKKIPTIVDPKKRNFFYYKNATLFKPNLKELKEGLNVDFDINNLEELQKAVTLLREKLSLSSALITLSENGVFIDNGEETFHQKAHIRNIADVSGAGDTVVSVAGLCLSLDLSNQFLASLANLAGGLVCEYLGVVSVDKEQLLKEAEENNLESYL